MRGIFIVLEGPDGAGTTKHSKLLSDRLAREGKPVLCTFEPTDGPIGSAIRSDLRAGTPLSPLELQERFCADRAWHLTEVIEPALREGTTVISDRYLHSTIAYGLALNLARPELDEMNKKFIRPDVTLFLLPPFTVLQERMTRRDHTDALERTELQRTVYAAYRKLAEEDPAIHVIDTSGSLEEVAEKIYTLVR
ncbi:MAG: dTMP kinase [Candidatus Peribacter riflensis]|uniref:Thymidylate kinase n=1 Tax=Candidatus Peribacter riflensis TaxID=1735162 RepID=A0A0S1SLV1_9BACT|nr:MAG: dTMP kinase [Candidatus Peribacter riflensis]ALM10859.1 MAG: thymidylate kinase [Candidatus Peribacter riflensis]ALM11961.1 MAG: dTMP kinase [Candidatus Peribacter riflensis]ALM13064.1 MAG: dTMP kinase [Candidatus Peribacter riflensis]ALM14164.1 MAG: dTMP kinase [Candidatus Peribacter riflensis]